MSKSKQKGRKVRKLIKALVIGILSVFLLFFLFFGSVYFGFWGKLQTEEELTEIQQFEILELIRTI